MPRPRLVGYTRRWHRAPREWRTGCRECWKPQGRREWWQREGSSLWTRKWCWVCLSVPSAALQPTLPIRTLPIRSGHPFPSCRTLQRLIKSPAIKERLRFRGTVASGRLEKRYNELLSRHVLTRFLELVLLMDRAKVRRKRKEGGCPPPTAPRPRVSPCLARQALSLVPFLVYSPRLGHNWCGRSVRSCAGFPSRRPRGRAIWRCQGPEHT